MTLGIHWFGLLACLGLVLCSCGPGEDQGPVDCDQTADHYAALCANDPTMEYIYEEWRLDCKLSEGLFDGEGKCVAQANSCLDAAYCGPSITFTCDTDEHCAGAGFCVDGQDCRACTGSEHCAAGKVCSQGLCIDEDNPLLEAFE